MKYSKRPLNEVLEKYTFAEDFLKENHIDTKDLELSLTEVLKNMDETYKKDFAIDEKGLIESFDEYIDQMKEFLGLDDEVMKLTILPGKNKSGQKESFDKIELYPSEIISIVGPTGSGKSRLLADIEWTARNDTPTGRTVLINDETVSDEKRFSTGKKLVAQLSQNMNFVMDLSVGEFLKMHAESRMADNAENLIKEIHEKANELAGEKFSINAPITSLSGGQSRALMIADTAILSKSPIVLIDEIENAGIDRKKAIELLVKKDKIVLMATHDPYLALLADIRIVINNGGIEKVIKTGKKEKELLIELTKIDNIINNARNMIREGKSLDNFTISAQ